MQSILLDSYSLHSLTTPQTPMVKTVAGLGFPEVRTDSYNRPGSHGVTIAHNLYGGRLISLDGTLRGVDAATYMSNRQNLEAAVGLLLDANNVPIARTLYLTDNNYSQYQVSVITKAFTVELNSPTVAKWQLQLLATDYTIQSQTSFSASMGLPQSGGVSFPVTFPITFGASSGGSATAASAGNAPSFPTITITGPCINPAIVNTSTGERLGLNITLLTGDTLTINARQRTIVQGASTNRMSAKTIGSTFFALLPGNNNLQFSADAYDAGTATLTWRSNLLGI